jgi:fatty acid desaturase
MLIVWSGVFLWLCPMAVLRVYGLSYFLYLVASDPLLLSQHSHIPQDRAEGRKVAPIPYYEQDLYTRSVVFPKWISKWVLLYFDRHGVHHYFPSLPLYRLGDMQEPVRNQIAWWPWLRAAKKMPAHRLLLENSLQTGIVF